MGDRERDTFTMLPAAYVPTARRKARDQSVELCRRTNRSASMWAPSTVANDGDEAAAAFYDDHGIVMFHTGPLMRSPAASQFVSMSGPLYGGRYRGTPTPPAQPLRPPSPPAAREKPRGKSSAFALEEADTDRWADEGGGYGRKEHLLNSGQLGMCNNPYCTTCPGAYHAKVASPRRPYRASTSLENRLHNILYGDARGWARKYFSFINSSFPVMNPHTKFVQQWNQFFVISCLVAIFIDPLFFFILSVDERHKCIVFNSPFAIAIAVVRSVTDFIYLLHMLLQFRLAYVAPESRVVGTGDFVVEPKKIAVRYLRGYFLLDLFVMLPLPQVMILVVIPAYLGSSAANFAKNLLRATVLLQYIPRIFRFLPFLAGQSSSGFIFESAWANFVINLLMFMLAGHVMGSCWYLFGLQQISTLAGNQTPSDFVWEVLFTMAIIGLGLLLFALLIGNMQNFLQALGRRRLEMQLRRRDVEEWMSHRRLPEVLRRQVRQAERFNWAATRGVNEEELLENLQEDLQRNIRRHLFTFLKKVRIFHLMDEPILDAIRERLRQKLYIAGSYIQYQSGPIEKMVFIVRGKMESFGVDGHAAPLSEGDVCGEELLAWYLEHSYLNKDGGKIRFPGQRLFSNRTVRCITNVEAFALRAADLEDVTAHFARFLRNPRVQGAIRYESPYWRTLAARRIQVAWRYRMRRLRRIHRPNQRCNPTN